MPKTKRGEQSETILETLSNWFNWYWWRIFLQDGSIWVEAWQTRRIKLHSHIYYRCHSMSCVFSFAENYRLLPFNRWPITCIATRFIPAEIFAVSGITRRPYLNIRRFHASLILVNEAGRSEERKRMIPTEKKRISCKYCPTIHNCSALLNCSPEF